MGEIDPTTPNVARIYDYYLGGTDNFPADREAGDRVLATSPEVRTTLRANRSFLGRAVRHLVADAGIAPRVRRDGAGGERGLGGVGRRP